MNGIDILLRLGCTDGPVDFNEENFPPGSFAMGGSGKLICIESWTFTADARDGTVEGSPIPTAVAKVWDGEWYDDIDAPPPADGGRSTTLKASSFGAPSPGKGWKIRFPLSEMNFVLDIPKETTVEEPVTKVVVPSALVGDNPFERPADENTGTIGPLPEVEIPDEHVLQPEPDEPEAPEVKTLTVSGEKTGPHPGARTKAGKFYNHVLESGCAVRLDAAIEWAADAKVAKNIVEVKKLVSDLSADGWPIALVGDGTENPTISIMGVLVGEPQPSRLDMVRATMFQYGQQLLEFGVKSAVLEVEFDGTTTIKVSV